MQEDKNYQRSILSTKVKIKAPRYWGMAPDQSVKAGAPFCTPQASYTTDHIQHTMQTWAQQ